MNELNNEIMALLAGSRFSADELVEVLNSKRGLSVTLSQVGIALNALAEEGLVEKSSKTGSWRKFKERTQRTGTLERVNGIAQCALCGSTWSATALYIGVAKMEPGGERGAQVRVDILITPPRCPTCRVISKELKFERSSTVFSSEAL
jgi:DNA-binding transcriptional ArsR family regulator